VKPLPHLESRSATATAAAESLQGANKATNERCARRASFAGRPCHRRRRTAVAAARSCSSSSSSDLKLVLADEQRDQWGNDARF
jgi:hypothetical protein